MGKTLTEKLSEHILEKSDDMSPMEILTETMRAGCQLSIFANIINIFQDMDGEDGLFWSYIKDMTFNEFIEAVHGEVNTSPKN